MIHIMLDLETWGTDPGCDIRSIGACVFSGDTQPPEWPTFYRATDNPIANKGEPLAMDTWEKSHTRKYPLTRDPQTVQWWSEQSDEAQAAFADPIDLREVLIEFGEWLQTIRGSIHQYSMSFKPIDDIRLWSHGPGFDPPILAAAYRAVNLPVPWHYRAPRDTRTIFDLAGRNDHSVWLNAHPGPLGIPHHALDDAISQARAVCGAWSRISHATATLYNEHGVDYRSKP